MATNYRRLNTQASFAIEEIAAVSWEMTSELNMRALDFLRSKLLRMNMANERQVHYQGKLHSIL